MSSLSIFIDWFKEYYTYEFTELDKSFKDEQIEEVLLNNSKYITKEMVINHDGCVKCGICCSNQHCNYYDSNTKLCTIHDNPIHELCKTYPWTGEDLGIAPLTLNCEYQVSFFVWYLDNFFQEVIE